MSEAVVEPGANPSPESKRPGIPGFDAQAIIKSPAFIPGLAIFGALCLAFFSLFSRLPHLWFEGDGYYSHGALIPFMSGYVVYKNWDKIKDVPAKGSWFGIPVLLVTGWVLFAGVRIEQIQIQSFALVITLLGGTLLIGGWRWLRILALPMFLLLFALPIWSNIIDTYTNPLQQISTDVSYGLLKAFQFDPLKVDATTIHLPAFTLDVGVPCSGLKLLIAVSAFTTFFIMIGGLKWWGNMIMLIAIMPLCLFINGLRIALIGVVGNQYGAEAGHQFHDYSGYITLLICFFLLFKLMRLLGWED